MNNKSLLIIFAVIGASAGAYVALNKYQKNQWIANLEKMRIDFIKNIPIMPFENIEPLSDEQKALSAPVTDDKAVMAVIANKISSYNLEAFYKAASEYESIHKLEKIGDIDIEKEANESGQKTLEKYKSIGNYDLISQKVTITLSSKYRGEDGFPASINPYDYFTGSPFSFEPFRDTPEPRKIGGSGSSALARAASRYPEYVVSRPLWKAPASFLSPAVEIPLSLNAIAYYDVKKSNISSKSIMAHCVQLDIYEDDQYKEIIKSSGCNSINIKKLY